MIVGLEYHKIYLILKTKPIFKSLSVILIINPLVHKLNLIIYEVEIEQQLNISYWVGFIWNGCTQHGIEGNFKY